MHCNAEDLESTPLDIRHDDEIVHLVNRTVVLNEGGYTVSIFDARILIELVNLKGWMAYSVP